MKKVQAIPPVEPVDGASEASLAELAEAEQAIKDAQAQAAAAPRVQPPEPEPEPGAAPAAPAEPAREAPPAGGPLGLGLAGDDGDGEAVGRAEYERLKKAHETLLGKYKSEIEEMKFLRDGLRERRDGRVARSVAEPEIEPPLAQQEIDALGGAEYAAAIQRIARREQETALAKLRHEQDERMQRLEGVIHQRDQREAVERFLTRVEARAPGFRKLDATDVGWRKHLETVDPDSDGMTYRQICKGARETGDVGRVAGVVRDYMAKAGISGSVDERPVMPGVELGETAVRPAPKKIITTAQVAEFNKRVSQGDYVGREKEMDEILATIERAAKDGRLR